MVKPGPKTEKTLSLLAHQNISLTDKLKTTLEHSDDWSHLKKEIEKIDKDIDKEIYKLYDLSDQQVAIIENSA